MKSKRLAWIFLLSAGLLELVWAYFLKLSHGFTVLIPSVITIVVLIVSFFLLGHSVSVFGIGMSYAVFTGIGIAGTTLIGIVLLNESVSVVKIISLIVLLAGIIGLKLCDGEEAGEK